MAKKIQHLVDIIIPTFNRKQLLKRAVCSVYNQSYKNWRLIIIDDASTDGTSAQDYGDKSQVLTLKQNKGVSYARNYAIQQSQANWLAFLDSDDEWKTHKLEKQVEAIDKFSNCPLIHCNEIWINKGKRLNQKKKHKKRGGRIFSDCVDICCISPSATLINKSVFKTLGLFKEDFPVCEDYEFWLRLSSRYQVAFLDEPLIIKYGGHSNQLSRQFFAMDYWRVKALFPFLNDKHLSSLEKQKVKHTIIKKAEILLRGYKKYNNLEHQKEIQEIYKKTIR